MLRTTALLVLTASFTALLALAIAAHVFPFITTDGEVARTPAIALLLIAVATPLGLLWLVYRLRLHSWWWIGGGLLVLAPVLAYLAADDPVLRRPMSIEEIAPPFPGAEKSYALLLRFAKNRPEAHAFSEPGTQLKWPARGEDYAAFATANRETLVRGWEALAPIRAWYDELNAFDRIGDLGSPSADAEIPAYAVHRSMSRHARAQACLLTLQGRGDEAAAAILPLLGVGRKMQTHARTLVRALIGLHVRREGLHALEFLLDRATLSPAMRARLVQELGAGAGGEAGVRRMVAIEYVVLSHIVPRPELSGPLAPDTIGQRFLGPFSHFLFNRNRTINLLNELATEIEELAARRQSARLDHEAAIFWNSRGRPGLKNLLGASFISSGYPSMGKYVERYWDTEDAQAALLTRLRQN